MTKTPPRIEREEQARARFVATVDGATSNEDLLDPEFWTSATGSVQPGDIIVARRRRDEIELVVEDVAPDGVTVRPLHPLPDEAAEIDHVVICRKSDEEAHQYGASFWLPDGTFSTRSTARAICRRSSAMCWARSRVGTSRPPAGGTSPSRTGRSRSSTVMR